MAERSRGMGRGLAALLAPSDAEREQELRELPVELISPNPRQPRQSFDEEGLLALADSLRERGLLQPVLVRADDRGHGLEPRQPRGPPAPLARDQLVRAAGQRAHQHRL